MFCCNTVNSLTLIFYFTVINRIFIIKYFTVTDYIFVINYFTATDAVIMISNCFIVLDGFFSIYCFCRKEL